MRYAILFLSALAAIGAPPVAQKQGIVTVVRLPEGGLQPQIATDSTGGVHLVYFKGDAANGDLFYSRVSDNGTLSSPLRVNSQAGSAIAVGNVRGARVVAGRNGRVHVTWNGSGSALPKAAGGATPMLYARLNSGRTAFEAQRNVLQYAVGLDGGGAIAADQAGRVHVAWHANGPGVPDETTRRVWMATSVDDGGTFAREEPVSAVENGACGCCGMSGISARSGELLMLYRAAREMVHRDTYLLSSKTGKDFSSTKLQEWNVGACPMSTFSLSEGGAGVLAAWETGGQVQFTRIDPATGVRSVLVDVAGTARDRKHPIAISNTKGEVLFAWTEGMRWQRGGTLAWQVFDTSLRRMGSEVRRPGVPMWSLVAAYARKDGGFVVVY